MSDLGLHCLLMPAPPNIQGDQDGYWSGKSQGNLIFLQGRGKVREFCKMVRNILNTEKARENCLAVAGILSIMSN